MDTRVLKQFINLADSLHFGRASEASHVSPSAMSRSIRQLEEELGMALFERDNRSVALTHAGETFLNYARNSLAQWDDLRNDLMEEAGELRGEVSIYCSVTASYSFYLSYSVAFVLPIRASRLNCIPVTRSMLSSEFWQAMRI